VFECVHGIDEDHKLAQLDKLDQMGFETVGICGANVERCIEIMPPDIYEYPVDGLIFEFSSNSFSKSLEATSHHEGCRMAFKWADNTYETVLRDVIWDVGRSGVISPVAVFDEVDLDGALTTRATLHNLSVIEELELGINDIITVYRSNMVIPKIDENLTRSNNLVIPDVCPCCGKPTKVKYTDNSKFLICANPDCAAKKLAQFTHFVSRNCMNIDGLSERTLETFISQGYLKTFRDIYYLHEHRNKLIHLDGFGPKSIDKLLASIEKSRHVKLENFIAALGIPNIGLSAAKTISQYFNGDFNTFAIAAGETFDFTQLDDFGTVMSESVITFMYANVQSVILLANEMNFIIPEKVEVKENPFTGKNICVTGKLHSFTRNSINEKIASLGAKAVSSVSGKTDYLITNEQSNSSKYKKAIELNIPIITEDEFLDMLGE
jgi:DNA ligase (NAD+)